jgi:hypothetical protein
LAILIRIYGRISESITNLYHIIKSRTEIDKFQLISTRLMEREYTILPNITIILVLAALLSITNTNSELLKETLAQQEQQERATTEEQTAFPSQTGDTELAGMLVKDAIQSLREDATQRALNYLTLVDQQLPITQRNGLAGMLVKDAIQSLREDDTQRALNYLTLVDQQLSNVIGFTTNAPNNQTSSNLPASSGEFNPEVVTKGTTITNSTAPASSGEFNCKVQTKGGIERVPCE